MDFGIGCAGNGATMIARGAGNVTGNVTGNVAGTTSIGGTTAPVIAEAAPAAAGSIDAAALVVHAATSGNTPSQEQHGPYLKRTCWITSTRAGMMSACSLTISPIRGRM